MNINRKRMGCLITLKNGKKRFLIKGIPEAILPLCTKYHCKYYFVKQKYIIINIGIDEKIIPMEKF